MTQSKSFLILIALTAPAFGKVLTLAQEPALQSAGAAYAPTDPPKQGHDPTLPLTKFQRNELMSEFKGLVHLGLKKVTYDQWKSKELADCDQSTKEAWRYRCEIMTGQGNAFYYFYPTGAGAVLQKFDVRVHASDARLLDDFRTPVQDMFGRASIVEKPTENVKTRGTVRRWNPDGDVIELYMDHTTRAEGAVRFIWTRS